MPLYEYKCAACGKIFEVIQKFADEPLTTHPDCGGAVKRLFSAPAFHLKGTGWYATDYAAKGARQEKTGEGKPDDGKAKDKDSPATPPPTAESKPAASTETKPSTPA